MVIGKGQYGDIIVFLIIRWRKLRHCVCNLAVFLLVEMYA